MNGSRRKDLLVFKCDLLFYLFRAAWKKGLDMETFISKFMSSDLEVAFNTDYSFYEGVSEYYMLDLFYELCPEAYVENKSSRRITEALLEWIAYVYRTWSFCTGESSAEVYRQAPFSLLCDRYLYCHDMTIEEAIKSIKEGDYVGY